MRRGSAVAYGPTRARSDEPTKSATVSREGLEALRARVYGDPELALRLRRVEAGGFSADVLRLASQHGLDVTDVDIADAIRSAQRAWTLRWVR